MCGIQPPDAYIFVYGNRIASNHLGTGFFVHKGIRSVVKRVEFINVRMSYIILKYRWCYIFLTVHEPTEEKLIIQRTSFT
jgi:hypothetical protein